MACFWLGLLDVIFGLDYLLFFFLPNSNGTRGPQEHSSRRGVFFFLRHIPQNGHKWSKKVISGPGFLKNDDIWLNFIKLDQIGSSTVSRLSREGRPRLCKDRRNVGRQCPQDLE